MDKTSNDVVISYTIKLNLYLSIPIKMNETVLVKRFVVKKSEKLGCFDRRLAVGKCIKVVE